MESTASAVLVLGLGNRLLGDDAAGPLVIDRLLAQATAQAQTLFLDGGTIGLGLLPQIERAAGLIAVDAAALGAAAGTVQVFEEAAMDRQVGGRKKTAHEVALADLLAAAALSGSLPERRALVAVEPETTAVGTALSAAVVSALPRMCLAVQTLLQRWEA
jgi:hydrogenase maturation protease